MRFRMRMCIAAAAFLISLAQVSAIDQPVRIIEPEMRSSILEKEIAIVIPISNNSGESISGILRLELIDPNDWVDGSSDIKAQLKPGRNSISAHLSNDYSFNRLLWFRVRYSFQVETQSMSSGIVSLVAISPGIFEITAVAPSEVFPGKPYRIRVHASNPVTHQPISGVQVRGKTRTEDMDDEEASSELMRTTDSAGDAILPFTFPKDAEDDVLVKLESRRGDQVRESEISIHSAKASRYARFAITTDKPLYQPGQSFHARVLMLRSDRQVTPDEVLRFDLLDPASDKVLTGTGTTNEFGIANVDWDLPETLEPGEYELRVSMSKENDWDALYAVQKIRVSRYDLSNFAVTVKPDRAYYLSGQNASVEISAKYLFGKELTAGSVKLVRISGENESEFPIAELDKSGKTLLNIDLSESHAQLTHEQSPNFLDLTYATSITDPSSGKAERREFDLRVSRAPIHIYVSNKSVIGNRAFFYLSAYYPDGRPAECQISIKEDPNYNPAYSGGDFSNTSQLLGRYKTNSYGVAKISDLGLLARADNHRLLFDVRDRSGLHTQFADTIDDKSHSLVRISTDKTIYKTGDSVIVSALTSESVSGRIAVDVTRNGIVLWNGGIRLHDHRGFAIIPYLAEFKGEVSITAYLLDYEVRYSSTPVLALRTVFFPDPSSLKLSIRLDRGSYRPGDMLSAVIHTSTVSGAPAKSALGAFIIDKALQQRAQSDQRGDSGRFESPNWSWFYSTGSIGGISRKNLAELDLTRPLQDGLDLAAEILLSVYDPGYAPKTKSPDYSYQIYFEFADKMKKDLAPVRAALLNQDAQTVEFATNSREVAAILKKAGIDISTVRDPWDMPYQYRFGVDQRLRNISILSTGPDKRLDTMDDFSVDFLEWNYFLPYGRIIDRVVKETHATSGSFIKDLNALGAALIQRGLDLKSLLDPWGNPYQFTFEVNGPSYDISVYSKGPVNGCCQFSVWSSSIDYFESTRISINEALNKNLRVNYTYPMEEESFDRVVFDSGIQFRRLLDPWGHAYYVKISYEWESVGQYEQIMDRRIQEASSVTGRLAWIRIFSCGPDSKSGTADDFLVAGYSKDILVRNGSEFEPQPISTETASKTNGEIRIAVIDPSSVAVSGAVVLAYVRGGGQQVKARSDVDGSYLIRNIPAGIYDIAIFYPSFVITQVRDVVVQAGSLTKVNAELVLDTTHQSITVTAEAPTMLLESSSSIGWPLTSGLMEGTLAHKQEGLFTPRLREYFPETLYWEPSIITDSYGTARIKLKLADSMTTWKMTVLASTKSGQVEIGEKEIEVFQPFFIEHDPPQALTVGDEIDLPVIVRNYLPKAQPVNIEMKPASWFELQQPGTQMVTVAAGESKPVLVPFKVTGAAKSAKQQVYAANRTIGDAVEKTIQVHPYGMERNATDSGYIGDESTLTLRLDDRMIPGSQSAQLKIYLSALAHVSESIEAGLIRPYGCGEQTTSSTYPSLILLKYYRESKSKGPFQTTAESYLKLGYKRLLRYRAPDGGFSYWAKGNADVALTAYVLRFLRDASKFTDVDPEIISDTEEWLESQQRRDGSWASDHKSGGDDLTAYVTFVLATKDGDKSNSDSIARAMTYLSGRSLIMQSPYALAAFALAAGATGDRSKAAAALDQLSKLAVPEGSAFYWNSEEATPFSGWGLAGNIEKTAMAVQAFSIFGADAQDYRRFVEGGTLWLFRKKDEYGVWHSGQATVLVLDAILKGIRNTGNKTQENQISITVNGQPVSLNPASLQSDAPMILDISGFVKPGENSIKLKCAGKFSAGSIQAVASYYVPWDSVPVEKGIPPLKVTFDKTDAGIGDLILCKVEVGQRGNRGMMLAEIGLPPGSEVDRAMLDNGMQSNSGISRYDILPDRVVLYLDTRIENYRLSFGFRLRYALNAYSAPSTCYFYYNPDSRIVLPPQKFHIRKAPGK